jgi:hypothetical protein
MPGEGGQLSAKAASRALAVMRRLCRHAYRIQADEGASQWTRFLLDAARTKGTRAELRQAAAAAADIAACFDAVHEQSRLLETYQGANVDDRKYREKAAARVGLKLPDSVPLAARDVSSKYDLSSRLVRAGGIEGLKQQLYGRRNAAEERA